MAKNEKNITLYRRGSSRFSVVLVGDLLKPQCEEKKMFHSSEVLPNNNIVYVFICFINKMLLYVLIIGFAIVKLWLIGHLENISWQALDRRVPALPPTCNCA